MRQLTDEALKHRTDFYSKFGGEGNCSCHISAPCSSCLHPGNPVNQEEDEDCWIEVADEDEASSTAEPPAEVREPFAIEVCVKLVYMLDANQFPPWATDDGVMAMAGDALETRCDTLDFKALGQEGIFRQEPTKVLLGQVVGWEDL